MPKTLPAARRSAAGIVLPARSVDSMGDRRHLAAVPTDGRHAVADLPPGGIKREAAEQG